LPYGLLFQNPLAYEHRLFITANERGTAVATYYYAHFNETLLGNRSVFLARGSSRGTPSVEYFAKRFPIHFYEEQADLHDILKDNEVKLCYHLIPGRKAHGQPNYRRPEGCRIAYHCVSSTSDPAGDAYAPISRYLNDKNGTSFPLVPHMISLPDHNRDMREELSIPADATVIGRHGGACRFNIHFAHELLHETVQSNPNI
jgi:hypothetical protein